MYKQPTVFILGAGASWHYGYPTGERLIERVIETSERLVEVAQALRSFPNMPDCIQSGSLSRNHSAPKNHNVLWDRFSDLSKNLAMRLKTVRPLVIDYFLTQNVDLQLIGKFVIAWVILECERAYLERGGNPNRIKHYTDSPYEETRARAKDLYLEKFSDDWYKFLIDGISSLCQKSEDLSRNKLHIVTFNYDISVEQNIVDRLTAIDLFQPNDVERFMADDRVLHIYGKVRDHASRPPSLSGDVLARLVTNPENMDQHYINTFYEFIKFSNFVFQSSEKIQTIGNEEKDFHKNIIENAQCIMKDAKHIYILGYGFDERNNDRIGIKDSLATGGKNIMFTNFDDSNLINKRASTLFLSGSIEGFLPPKYIKMNGSNYFEKSTRDTYGALEKDFFHFERS